MNKREEQKRVKMLAQDLIMKQMGRICYGNDYQDSVKEGLTLEVLKHEMDRVAKLFNFEESWFY